MKLLLTSAGINNPIIVAGLMDLVGMPAQDIRCAFIPTAAHVEAGDKTWLINDLVNFRAQGFASIDIVDIAAVGKDEWYPRLQDAHVLCFGGGNEQFLARKMHESGLSEVIRELLKSRVYVGISAGSMVAGKFLPVDALKLIYPDENLDGTRETALGLVHCSIIPHLNSPWFPQSRTEVIESLQNLTSPLYALDDNSALKIIDGAIEVIGGGAYVVR